MQLRHFVALWLNTNNKHNAVSPQRALVALTLLAWMGGCGTQSHTSAEAATTTPGPVVKNLAGQTLNGCILSDYYVGVKIGSQSFNLLVDSGSTTTAVAASDCSNCGVTPTYNRSGSSQGGQVSASYGDNSGWTGSTWSDSMEVIANINSNIALTPAVTTRFAAIDAQVGSTDFYSATYCDANNTFDYQGILGLGPDDLLLKGTDSFLSNLAASKTLTHDAFAVQLCDMGGNIWFGGYDDAVTTSDPFFAPLVTAKVTDQAEYYYGINLVSVGIGGKDSGIASSDLPPMIVDTGTSGLYLPTNAFNALNAALQKNSTFLANFSSHFLTSGNASLAAQGLTPEQLDAALPTLSLGFAANGGTGTLTLTATKSYMMATKDTSGDTLYVPLATAVSGTNPPILGAAALRSHVTIFDRENAQVGFAPQSSCPATLPVAPSGN